MHVLLAHVTFANEADARDAYDQIRARAQNASVARIGEAGERTSHSLVGEEQPDGSITTSARWHIDDFGILRDGDPDPTEPPAWIQPTGAQDAYPLTDVRGNPVRVIHNGAVWQNNTAANTWEPGVFGWDAV